MFVQSLVADVSRRVNTSQYSWLLKLLHCYSATCSTEVSVVNCKLTVHCVHACNPCVCVCVHAQFPPTLLEQIDRLLGQLVAAQCAKRSSKVYLHAHICEIATYLSAYASTTSIDKQRSFSTYQ
jgi:hypothetical protein